MRYLLLSLSCAATLLWGANASCYYPDGSFPEDYVYAECSEEENTGCCILSEGDQCLSNGLCYDPSSQYLFRGGCSDKSWNSTNCFQHCKTGDSTSTYDPLVPCGDNRYCCSSEGSTCCNDDSKVFTVGAATVIKDLASTGAFSIPIETPTALPTSDPETTAEAEPTAEPTTEPKETSKNARPSGTAKQTGSAAASTSTSTSPAGSEAESESSGLSKTALIAIAVAGVVVLLLAIGLVWFLVRRRYRKKIAAGTNPQSFPMASEGFQKLPDKSPRPVEVPVPMQSPAPPYQPPAYGAPMATYGAPHPPMNGAVEIGHFDGPPGRGPNGQVVYEAPAQNYHR